MLPRSSQSSAIVPVVLVYSPPRIVAIRSSLYNPSLPARPRGLSIARVRVSKTLGLRIAVAAAGTEATFYGLRQLLCFRAASRRKSNGQAGEVSAQYPTNFEAEPLSDKIQSPLLRRVKPHELSALQSGISGNRFRHGSAIFNRDSSFHARAAWGSNASGSVHICRVLDKLFRTSSSYFDILDSQWQGASHYWLDDLPDVIGLDDIPPPTHLSERRTVELFATPVNTSLSECPVTATLHRSWNREKSCQSYRQEC